MKGTTLSALAAAAGLTLLATACGNSPGSGGSAGGSPYQQSLAYAQCMRSHGEPAFPDPNSDGNFVFTPNNPLDTGARAFKSASGACKSLRPKGDGLTAAQTQAGLARLLKYSDCMRNHGLVNFPDPKIIDSGGRRGIVLKMSGPGISPRSPQFQAASQACQHLLPLAGTGAP